MIWTPNFYPSSRNYARRQPAPRSRLPKPGTLSWLRPGCWRKAHRPSARVRSPLLGWSQFAGLRLLLCSWQPYLSRAESSLFQPPRIACLSMRFTRSKPGARTCVSESQKIPPPAWPSTWNLPTGAWTKSKLCLNQMSRRPNLSWSDSKTRLKTRWRSPPVYPVSAQLPRCCISAPSCAHMNKTLPKCAPKHRRRKASRNGRKPSWD